MFIGFVGREAAELHGLKYALQQTYDLQRVGISEIPEVIAYQKEHGFKPVFMVQSVSETTEVYKALVNGL